MKVLLLAPVGVSGGISTWAQNWVSGEESIEFEVLDTARRYLTLGSRSRIRRAIWGATHTLARFVRVVRYVKAERAPDVVYVACAPSYGFWLRDIPIALLLNVMGTPCILHLHGGSVDGFFGRNRLIRRHVSMGMARSSAIVSITESVNTAVGQAAPSTRRCVVPNMIDVATVPTDPRLNRGSHLTILHVGWQSPDKGSLEVIEVAAQIPSCAFRMVGPIAPDMISVIDRGLAAAGNPSNITFVGELRGRALEKEFAEADLFLLPSHNEGFPMVILEAMRSGLPVVATDVGAISEMLGIGTGSPAGVTVPMANMSVSADIALSVVSLLSQSENRLEMGRAGSRRVQEKYAATVVLPQLADLVGKVAKTGHARRRR